MTREPRSFYAIEYAYGRNTINENGCRPDHIHRFETVRERERFLAEMEAKGVDADPVCANHSDVRKAHRYVELGDRWPKVAV